MDDLACCRASTQWVAPGCWHRRDAPRYALQPVDTLDV